MYTEDRNAMIEEKIGTDAGSHMYLSQPSGSGKTMSGEGGAPRLIFVMH